MSVYHISPDGTPRKCTAKPGGCQYGAEYPHFSTEDDARKAFELSEGLNKAFVAIRKTEKNTELRKKRDAERKRVLEEKKAKQQNAFQRDQALSQEYTDNPNFENGVYGEAENLEIGRERKRASIFRNPEVKALVNLIALKVANGDRSQLVLNLDERNHEYEEIRGYISLKEDSPYADRVSAELAEDISRFSSRHFPQHELLESDVDYYGVKTSFNWSFDTDL